MDAQSAYPWHRVPLLANDADISVAFADCFNTPAGQAVLATLYWKYVMTSPDYGEEGQRHIGKQEVFREINSRMLAGEAARRMH